MTEQMRTLLEMLRAAQADDMPALAEAEARAMRNQQERKRGELTELQSEEAREQKDPNEEDQHQEDVHPEEEDGTCMWEDDSRDMTRVDDSHTLTCVPLKPSPTKPRYRKKTMTTTATATNAADMAASRQSPSDPKGTVEKTEQAAGDDESIGIDDIENGKDDNVDNLMTTMDKDLEFIFHELSTFEGQEKQAKSNAGGADVPANPSPRKDGSDNNDDDDDDQSLIATAKIKYKLGQLFSTLKKNEKTSRFSGIVDPLLIDKDGFMVTEATDSEPSPNGVFETDFAPAFGSSPDEKDEKKEKP